jgi:hypothetical protein
MQIYFPGNLYQLEHIMIQHLLPGNLESRITGEGFCVVGRMVQAVIQTGQHEHPIMQGDELGSHRHQISPNYLSTPNDGHGGGGDNMTPQYYSNYTGGNETRPKNINVILKTSM